MDSFLFALNAVTPIVLTVLIGYLLKKLGLLNKDVAKAMNKVVFRLLLPIMLFLNVYKIERIADMDFGYVLFAVLFTVAIFIISIPVSMLISKDPRQRGVLSQAAFRSNYALIGIPLASSLFADAGSMVATILSAFIIPTLNILAVISLTAFGGGRINVKKILLGIVKNPLIWGVALGCITLGIRALFVDIGVEFRLTDIRPLYKVMGNLSACATPIALIMLGAQFEISAIGAMKKQIIFGTLIKTVAVPALGISAAYLIGGFSGAHFASFVAVFATPVSVSSVPMSQEMGADSDLAGQLVVWTTIISVFSIFTVSFILKEIGIFI